MKQPQKNSMVSLCIMHSTVTVYKQTFVTDPSMIFQKLLSPRRVMRILHTS